MSVATAPAEQEQTTRVPFRVDTRATKDITTSDDGTLTLRGYANTWSEDRDGETVAKDAFDGSWGDYISKNPMLLYQHNPDWPIGKATEGKTDRTGLGITAQVGKPDAGEIPEIVTAYRKIAEGVLCTFSIGGFMQKTVKAGKRIISKVELFEISIVSVPANPDSIFVAATKALNGERMSELSPDARAQMEQLIGFQPVTDPDLVAMTGDQMEDHWAALSDLFKSATGVEPPPRDAWQKVKSAREAGADELAVAKASLAVAGRFYRPEDTAIPAAAAQLGDGKAGRTLSSANTEKLRKAKNHIEEVLAAGEPRSDSDESDNTDGTGWQDGEPLDSPLNPATSRMSAAARRAKAADESTYRNLEAAIRAAVAEQYPDPDEDGDDDGYCYVEDFSDSWVVYYHHGQLWQSTYTTSKSGDIELEKPVAVRPVTSYVELAIEYDHAGAPFFDLGQKGALPVRGLTVAAKAAAWDAGAAVARIKEWSGSTDAPSAKYAQAFLYRDGDGADYADYKFPVADVIDGELQYVAKAVSAAAKVVNGTDDSVASAVKPKLTTLYSKVASALDDDTIKPPWGSES